MQKESFFVDYTLRKWVKFSINSLAFLLLAPALGWGTTTIVITNPSPSLTVPSQFGVSAYAYGNDQIHVLQIYLDQVGKVYELVNPPRNRINTLITAGVGTRLVTVQAMDNSGHVLGLSQF
jgi:hypothetical protein